MAYKTIVYNVSRFAYDILKDNLIDFKDYRFLQEYTTRDNKNLDVFGLRSGTVIIEFDGENRAISLTANSEDKRKSRIIIDKLEKIIMKNNGLAKVKRLRFMQYKTTYKIQPVK